MKIPQTPPRLAEILKEPDQIMRIVTHGGIGPSQGKRYRHWENLRRIQPPTGLSSEEWWAAVKLARSQTRRTIPLKDMNGNAFGYCLADPVLESLYEIDRNVSGRITTTDQLLNPQTRDRYVMSSLIEEAITSSQLEGASTTRDAAKQMIRSGRNPMNRSERMILNNYRAIQRVKELAAQPLTPGIVFTIHETLVEGTLGDDDTGNHLRIPGDGVAVYHDGDGTPLHTPPPAREIARRMAVMCEFANKKQTDTFLHPILKAIILHFWLAYDHPFVDGNGRTARALFYWSALSQDFWMFEFLSISAVIRRSPTNYAKSFLYTETDENDLTYFLLAQLQVIRQAIKALYDVPRKEGAGDSEHREDSSVPRLDQPPAAFAARACPAPPGGALYHRHTQEDSQSHLSDGTDRPSRSCLTEPARQDKDRAVFHLHRARRLGEAAEGSCDQILIYKYELVII